jgi:hypothetical protein
MDLIFLHHCFCHLRGRSAARHRVHAACPFTAANFLYL